MEITINILRVGTISLLVVLILLLLRSKASRPRAIATTLFCFSVIGYLVVDWTSIEGTPIFFFFLVPTFSLPFFFWLFSKALFNDEFRLNKWMVPFWICTILLYFFGFLQNRLQYFDLPEAVSATVGLMPFFISLLFILMAIVEAVRNLDDDLILSRLRFRYWFIFLSSVLIIFTILVEIAFLSSTAPLALELMQRLFIFGLTLFFTLERLEFKPGFFKPDGKLIEEAETPPMPIVDEQLISNLENLIEGQNFYKTEGLTIRLLAEKLGVKEYKLRQAINQKLGFRNFNDYLNHYRVKEACQQLEDPSQKDRTILEIAYDMGFNSLAPFNKAFKKMTGMTPTEWRKRQ